MTLTQVVEFLVKLLIDGALSSVVRAKCAVMCTLVDETPIDADQLWSLVWGDQRLIGARVATMPRDELDTLIVSMLTGIKVECVLRLQDWAQGDPNMLAAADQWLAEKFLTMGSVGNWDRGIQKTRGAEYKGSPNGIVTVKTTEPGVQNKGKGRYGNHWENGKVYTCVVRGKYEGFRIEWLSKNYACAILQGDRQVFSYVGKLAQENTPNMSAVNTGSCVFGLLCVAKYLLTLDKNYLLAIKLTGDPVKWDKFLSDYELHPNRASNDDWDWVQRHVRVHGVDVPDYMGTPKDENGNALVVEYVL